MQPLKAPRSHASYKEEIDRLKGELEEANSWSLKAIEQFNRADELERQLAEARAEVERLKQACIPRLLPEWRDWIETHDKEVRQEAARECIKLAEEYRYNMLILDIKSAFGMEG